MRLLKADGSVAGMSGNGIRGLAQAVVQAGLATPPVLRVATDAGLRTVTVLARPAANVHRMSVEMGQAKVGEQLPEWVEGDILRAVHVDVGNPHRSEEHTSELQYLLRHTYACFCLKKKTNTKPTPPGTNRQQKTL